MTRPIRILIVDDHPVVRKGLRALLSTLEGFDVVGEARNADEGLRLSVQLRPDVLIADLHLPGDSGLDLTRRVRAAAPEVGVLVLTMLHDDESLLAAMRAGARGYVVKGADEDELVRAIMAVASGEAILGESVADRLSALFAEAAHMPLVFPDLTDRERGILELMARGHSNIEIARHLGLAPKTVRNQISTVFVKLGVTRRPEAIVKAREAGLGRAEH